MIFAPRRKAYLQHWPILLQIVLAHSAILADGLLLRFVNCQIGEKVISDLLVDAAVSVSIVKRELNVIENGYDYQLFLSSRAARKEATVSMGITEKQREALEYYLISNPDEN